MTDRDVHSAVSAEDLHRYFDAEAPELAQAVAGDPVLRRELDELEALQGLVRESLLVRAQEIPQARFEQIWAEVDRAIDREARAHAQQTPPSLWGRLRGAFDRVRVPAFAVAGAAALVLVLARVGGDEATDAGDLVVEAPRPAAPERTTAAPPEPVEPPVVAEAPSVAPPMTFPEPKAVEAEIHEVDFGGRSGRIAQTGTVTVLYVEEPAEPQESERSL